MAAALVFMINYKNQKPFHNITTIFKSQEKLEYI
jgi:hypothetical protein